MEVTERNSGNLDHGYMVMMGSLEQDPGGPSNQTKDMDGGVLPVLLLLLLPPPPPLPLARAEDASRANSDRYAVYWNRSNPREFYGWIPTWGQGKGTSLGKGVTVLGGLGHPDPSAPLTHNPFLLAATPPNAVDRPCLRLKVYVRPTNETLYEAPEPIFTSNNSCSSLGSCQLFLSTVPVLWTLLGS
ncbi:PREDICTED: ephrin-A2 [Myotis davidii]|uniref:ephrin-A2 n=1 Tax=Myotis davidii TaxID=225400 RepID=UPI000766EE26|nr:PREDICTED: ephrin-A2 [Myotis davidii]